MMIRSIVIRSFHRQLQEPNGCVMSSDLPWMSEPSLSKLAQTLPARTWSGLPENQQAVFRKCFKMVELSL